MNEIIEKFPEILLVEATYKLIDLRIPVCLLVVVDGDGLSEIVTFFILANQTKLYNLSLMFSKSIMNHGQKLI